MGTLTATYPTLYKMAIDSPSCMVAGTSGSGKSTSIQGILYTICCHSPIDRAYAIVDLKKISLLDWEYMPHCIGYVRDIENTKILIKQFVATMDKRYDEMLKARTDVYEGQHLYLVIDESADLLDSCPELIEDLKHIGRLGRACRVHLVYATQSPDRKTIPAQLQQNIAFRLGLRCISGQESRQIINVRGCEDLPMFGHGILISPEYPQPTKVVVPMVEQADLNHVISFWK